MSSCRAIVVLAVCLGVVGCEREEEYDAAADEAAIRQGTEALVAAFRAGDAAGAAALFASNGVMYPPNQPPVAGTTAIQAWGAQMLSAMSVVEGRVTVDQVIVEDDLAVNQGMWAMTVAMGENRMTDTTRFMLVWARQDDGSWKITHDIWNSIRPMPGM